jgi:hypothetical protein
MKQYFALSNTLLNSTFTMMMMKGHICLSQAAAQPGGIDRINLKQ